MTVQLQDLPLEAIRPSPHNPRIFRDKDPELASLAKSIGEVGVLHPVLVRPVHGVNGGAAAYELIAGERRWRAAKLAGVASIAATVRADLTEQQALELTVTENLQREDLHPLEEAKGVASLLGEGHDYRAVADRLGKSLGWVARRARLGTLSPTWRKLVEQRDSAIAGWSAEGLELVARLEPKAQDAFFQNNQRLRNQVTSIGELRRLLADYTLDLKLAPWKLDDDTLEPQAGACSTCPKRSSCNPGLFDEEETDGGKKARAGDRCLDATCWARKEDRQLARKADELKAKHGTVLFGGYFSYGEKAPAFVGKTALVSTYEGSPAKQGDKGAVPILVVAGNARGNVLWRKFGKADGAKDKKSSSGRPVVKSLKERREALEGRRRAHALEAICEAVERSAPPASDDLIALAAAFGTAHTMDRPGAYYADKLVKPLTLLARPNPRGRLWAAVAEVLTKRWKSALSWHGQKGLAEHQPEIDAIAKMVHLDLTPFAAAAAKAIPEPKSWGSLAANGSPKAKQMPKQKATKKASTKKAAMIQKPDDVAARAELIANNQCPDCGGPLPKGWLTCGRCDPKD